MADTLNFFTASADTERGKSAMPTRTGFLLVDSDKRLIRENAHTVRDALFACVTPQQVECSVVFARYMNLSGINSDNYWLFLRLIMTNNEWVIDELLGHRVPQLMFSTIRPDVELIDAAFEMLYSRHPSEMYAKALEAVLGIIQNAYFDPDDGYRIRKLSIMDVNALGKYLVKDETQEFPTNRLILEILDRIAHVGDYYGEQDKNVVSRHAFNIRYAYFDHTRNLVDAIPEPLLLRVSNGTGETGQPPLKPWRTRRYGDEPGLDSGGPISSPSGTNPEPPAAKSSEPGPSASDPAKSAAIAEKKRTPRNRKKKDSET